MSFIALSIISLVFKSIYAYELQNKLPLGIGSWDIESIEYDAINKQYITASWYSSQVLPFNQDIIEDSEYNMTDTTYLSYNTPITTYYGLPGNIWRSPIALGGSGAAGPAFDNDEFQPGIWDWRPAGMEIVDGNLYIVDFFSGRIAKYDINTTTYTRSIFINNTDEVPANLDGLCRDPANPNMLYTTDYGYATDDEGKFFPSGYEAVYAVNIDDWTWERIYDVDTEIEGGLDGYTAKPNGCVVVDGILYTVDNDEHQTQPQGWMMYDIAAKKWSVMYDILPETGGDGLVYVDEIKTFFSTDIHNGTLLKYEPRFDNKFEVVYDGMNGPADMAYNEDMRVLAIPELYTGFVNFIQLDDILFDTTQYFTTTSSMIEEEESIDNATMLRMFVTVLLNVYIFVVFS